jgi:hypothetical protein
MQESSEINTGAETAAPTEKSAATSVHEILAQQTEYKDQSNATVNSGWDFEEKESEEATDQPGANSYQQQATTEPAGNNASPAGAPGKITEDVRKASAETSKLLFDTAITMIGSLALKQKFKKRFSDEEQRVVIEQDLADRKVEEVEEEFLTIKRKFDRLTKKLDKKLTAIPLDPTEEKTVYDAFYNYYKVKNIVMPPEALLFFSLGSILVDRTLEVTLD